MQTFLYYFFIFILYSILGWCIEMISCYLYTKKLVNRGFLIGPYCPIYGTAALLMILCLSKYQDDLFALFIMSAFISSALEYMTSYLMEKIFKARWWDYSKRKFNINGRICLLNSLSFGILGIILIAYVYPFIQTLIAKIPTNYFNIITICLFITFLVDFIVSFKIIINLKHSLQSLKKDSTGEISKKVREKISESSKLVHRVLDAFPNLKPLLSKKKKKRFFFFK